MANGEYFIRALSLSFQIFTYSRADTDMAAASFDQKAKSCLDCVLGQPRQSARRWGKNDALGIKHFFQRLSVVAMPAFFSTVTLSQPLFNPLFPMIITTIFGASPGCSLHSFILSSFSFFVLYARSI